MTIQLLPPDDERLLADFVGGRVDPATFGHRAHLRVALALLRREPFLEACVTMRDGLQRVAAGAGHPDRYHETLTVALMSVLLDRLGRLEASGGPADPTALVAAFPELVGSAPLAAHYSSAMLARESARRRFVLPDPVWPAAPPRASGAGLGSDR